MLWSSAMNYILRFRFILGQFLCVLQRHLQIDTISLCTLHSETHSETLIVLPTQLVFETRLCSEQYKKKGSFSTFIYSTSLYNKSLIHHKMCLTTLLRHLSFSEVVSRDAEFTILLKLLRTLPYLSQEQLIQ